VIPNDSVVTLDYARNDTDAKKLSDGAGNYLASVGEPKTVVVTDDNTAPSVVSIAGSNSTTTTYTTGQTVNLVITFNEVVNVQGTPTLLLETGTTDRTADYASGSGTTALTFAYIVQSGDDSSDLNFKSSSSLTFGSDGMIKDNALNTADLDLSSIALLSASATDIIVDGS
jgi:hypothetical protein